MILSEGILQWNQMLQRLLKVVELAKSFSLLGLSRLYIQWLQYDLYSYASSV